ncbi:MAG: tripartite tricarboxylate transporter substrate binding protein, partial [Pseudolabrys sp.]
MRRNLGLLAFCTSLLISGSSGAQDASTRIATHYPEHSVRMVVGFTAGGPTDVIARIIAEKLSTSLG